MNKYEINYIDCTWLKCKNIHIIESIEIYFYIDVDDNVVIEYNFHEKDFNLWKKILEIHKENVEESILYDNFNEIFTNIENIYEYYTLKLKSKDLNLYRNISLIMYIKNEKQDNSKEMIKKNTWNI